MGFWDQNDGFLLGEFQKLEKHGALTGKIIYSQKKNA
jgi:hypothetical protein